ncbi:MAG: TRL domain-containing protein [Candidatus Gastranaerophilales bacterium]|nr:TRL domain-containing protein [Candidatus Gastranaerophilales bacterium]
MKRFILGLTLFCILTCAPANAMGLFYTDATYPMTATGVRTTKTVDCLKKGKSSAIGILFLVELGDAGLGAASKDGDIKQVYFVDINEKTVLIFFRKITTTVYGE